MTTRYRVEYALKTHRRDQFIEWIKGLLAVPFVLNSQPTAAYEEDYDEVKSLQAMAQAVHRRYAEIMRDVEGLVNDHIRHQRLQTTSKLKMLVPSIGSFFTPLHLEAAFVYQDKQRAISSRRFVAPSFNDVRLILNTAQVMALMRPSPLPSNKPTNLTANQSAPHTSNPTAATTTSLQLLTFDGDVTLYDDGASLLPTNPVIPRLIHFLSRDMRIGIVTAAGYTDASRYHARLHGLLDAIQTSPLLTTRQRHNLIIMGGESNFLFVFDETSPSLLRYIHRRDWILPVMHAWNEEAIQSLLSIAEAAFRSCIRTLNLPASILRKERAVGIYPTRSDHRFAREQLEETVLVVQQLLDLSPEARGAGIPFCAFNGGNDVFVDIGDKSLGVRGCQKWFGAGDGDEAGPVKEEATLHVGDQFLSGGGNDFKARLACTTAWITSPQETVALLDEMSEWEGVGIGAASLN
ncbi:hypothetical protein GJ744_004079 [Endocarpon pusillum]|uniref:IMP-specific 5'-nucleotidase 1 n=1 Tax=Endocarpon pusillum TaxID=364733 RepID=A0A8H7AR31_9EURO|nr:hypothetical protein GJ744_004079 [Endocarpon pusillum]